jgi:type I restriction enzyme S subunit
VGKSAVWREEVPGACFQNTLIRVRPGNAILPEYLQKHLQHDALRGALAEVARGIGIHHLGAAGLVGWEIAVPPLPEQKRITDKLDSLLARVDACRQRLDRVSAIIKRSRQSLLAAATSGELTREWREARAVDGNWPVVTLESVATGFSYGSAAKSAKSGGVPVLRMGNIQDGQLDWGDLVFTSDADEIDKYRLSAGDVLFNRTNSPELVGKTAVFRGEREAIYAGYLIRVRCGDQLLPDYLNYCLGSPAGRDYCWQVKSDGVSQSNINATKLAAFTFGLPSIGEQQEIVRRVEELLAAKRALEKRLRRASDIVASLVPAVLAKAFRGELVPQDPNDEPASAMLERVRAQRPAAVDHKASRPSPGSSRSKAPARPKDAAPKRRRAS